MKGKAMFMITSRSPIRKDNPVTYPDGGQQGEHFNAGKPAESNGKLKQHHNYGDQQK